VSRIFVSHSSKDNRQAAALRAWLVAQDPPLANEIFLDTDTDTGLQPGARWKNQLISANSRCEAVICLLSHSWESSAECLAEYRTAENLGKQILCARLQEGTGRHTTEWQYTDLFADGLPEQDVETIAVRGGPPVVFAKAGLHRLREAIRGAGIGAENFVWPPPAQPERAPYRGWESFEELDAGVFFGRDAQIVRALDMLRAMRSTGVDSLFAVLGPSGSGKSSFLRAGLLPRCRREDRHFVVLDIMRPERHALTGDSGLAQAIYGGRRRLGLERPALGDVEIACTTDAGAVRRLLAECRLAAAQGLPDVGPDAAAPTLVLPLDQAEELFSADTGGEAAAFLELIAELAQPDDQGERLGLIVAGTIRTDRYELMQTAPALAGLTSEVFDDLKPMPDNQFREVITGPAARASAGGDRLSIAPDLVNRLLDDAAAGGDALPLLALTLRRLYDRYGATGELTLASYEAMGGMEKVVQSAVDEVLAADPEQRGAQLAALRAAFIPWLATINPDNDQPMRRVARWSDLPESSRALIEAFVEERLLVKDQRGGEVVVEVALESLLRQWHDLAGWLREERQSLVAADDIERAATAWRTHHDDPAWLLTGTRLADAETLAAAPGYHDRLARQPTRDYLAASRLAENQKLQEEEERRQEKLRHAEEVARLAQERQQTAEAHAADLRRRARILRAVLAGTAVVAVLAVVGAVVAVVGFSRATREARDALAAQLDTEASAVFSGSNAGSDIQALADTLAAQRIRSDPAASRGAFYTATTALNTTRVIIQTPAPVRSMAISPDGHMLASGSQHAAIRLWNLTDPAHPSPLGGPLTGHTAAVDSVAFSPDGHTLASGSSDDTIRLWNLTDPAHPGPLGQPLQVPSAVNSVAFSPDGHTLASGSNDHTIRLWNLTDPTHPGSLGRPLTGHTDAVMSVAFSPDGHTLASGSFDDTIRLWNLTDPARAGALGQPLVGHTAAVFSVAFSPDGHTLASASADDTIRLWNLTDPAQAGALGQPLVGHTAGVEAVAFSPDGHTLASGSQDDTIRLWNLTDPAHPSPLGQPLTGHTGIVWSVAFSPDGHTLASGSLDATVRLWNLDTALALTGHTGAVLSVAFSPDGHTLASGSNDDTIRLWNLTDPARAGPLGQPMTGHTAPVDSVAFSPDGHTLASGSQDDTIRLWNLTDPAHPSPLGGPLTGHTDSVWSVAFSPGGHTLASGSADDTIRLWNLTDPTHPAPLGQPLTGHSGWVFSVAFSPDGHTLAAGNADDTIQLWNLTDPTHPGPLGQPLQGHTSSVLSVAFSPDGHTLASGAADDTIRLWNLTDPAHPGPLGQPLVGHTGYVYGVAFSPDGHTLASGSWDDTVRLWNLTGPAHPGPLGQPLHGHTGAVWGVAFSPDGHTLASGSTDDTVRLWPTPLDATMATLCSKLTSNISHQDWHDWISPAIDYITLCPDLPVPQN
jgi:WD40 repeat protein